MLSSTRVASVRGRTLLIVIKDTALPCLAQPKPVQ